jgi:diguanylate cyclase (GGDEF)-like protein
MVVAIPKSQTISIGLKDRARFLDHLQQALFRQEERDWPLAVLFVDLEGFRFVNKSVGRAVGNTLLAAVAGRLGALVCERDVVGHWGGDKFVVVCESTVPGERARLVTDILNELGQPFSLGNQQLVLDSRIGIAVGIRGEKDPEELVRQAQAAVQEAREQGTCVAHARRDSSGSEIAMTEA